MSSEFKVIVSSKYEDVEKRLNEFEKRKLTEVEVVGYQILFDPSYNPNLHPPKHYVLVKLIYHGE